MHRTNKFNIRVYYRISLFFIILVAGNTQADDCGAPGAAENLARAQAFLIENKNNDGVITTASGLQYKILKAGSSDKKPSARDMVSTHYTLTNLDGKKLDSSHDRHMPLQFRVTEVIAGWQEALQLMSEGQQIQLVVPPELAYGCKGSPPIIGPMELLIFDMELIAIVR